MSKNYKNYQKYKRLDYDNLIFDIWHKMEMEDNRLIISQEILNLPVKTISGILKKALIQFKFNGNFKDNDVYVVYNIYPGILVDLIECEMIRKSKLSEQMKQEYKDTLYDTIRELFEIKKRLHIKFSPLEYENLINLYFKMDAGDYINTVIDEIYSCKSSDEIFTPFNI